MTIPRWVRPVATLAVAASVLTGVLVAPASATSSRQLLAQASALKDTSEFSHGSMPDRNAEWLASDRRVVPGTPYYRDRRTAVLQLEAHGFAISEWPCVDRLIWYESGWNKSAGDAMASGKFDPTKTWGLPQAMPASKMAAFGRNYRTSALTQLKWFYDYVGKTYGTPCGAWAAWKERAATGYGWY